MITKDETIEADKKATSVDRPATAIHLNFESRPRSYIVGLRS